MVRPLTYWDLQAKIKSEKIEQRYLFVGEETFLKRSLEQTLKEKFIPANLLAFNFNQFYAQETDMASVLNCVSTQPVMSHFRLVILKNVENWAAQREKLFLFLNKPIAHTCFIIETNKSLEDEFIRKLAAQVSVVNFARLQGANLKRWIEEYVQAQKRKITKEAVELLLEKLGTSLDGLANALDKLFLFNTNTKILQANDIETIVEKTNPDTRFALLEALSNRKTNKAISILHNLAQTGKNFADIIGLINWQLKRLEHVKNQVKSGYSQEEIAINLKVAPYILKNILEQSSSFSDQELKRDFRLLLEADVAIKQGEIEPLLALEFLIVRLCTGK